MSGARLWGVRSIGVVRHLVNERGEYGMRISEFMDDLADLPMLPIAVTENSKHKVIRVTGCLVYMVWALPAIFLWALVCAVLAIPAMIQDA